MRIRTKIFLGYFLAAATALYFLMAWVKDDVRKRYLESIEENMVDSANILACLADTYVENGKINTVDFNTVFKEVHERHFSAQIYDITKSTVDSQIYITDNKGIVLFDSGDPENVGKDFSRWRDVALTLRGEYGARATRKIADDPASLVMFISSPIVDKGEIIGVLSLYKPVNYVTMFIIRAEKRIVIHTLWAFAIVIFLGIVMSFWLTNPILKLTGYVNAVKNGEKTSLPHLGAGEMGVLAQSFDEMREALEGKQYVEEYVQNLTHELKSPIAAVQGALELLSEKNIPTVEREKFLKNINHENLRMRQIVDRMLILSQLENVHTISEKTNIDIIEIFQEIIQSVRTRSSERRIIFDIPDSPVMIKGDRILLYEAFENIISNAIDFTEENGKIKICIEPESSLVKITISDNGAGIPDYAIDKVFNKFYSLPRPGKKEKSSGLGLTITREIIELHVGTINIANNTEGGGTKTAIELHLI
jgi:two-component system, OmpR family, sensor histidine kinase CreC